MRKLQSRKFWVAVVSPVVILIARALGLDPGTVLAFGDIDLKLKEEA